MTPLTVIDSPSLNGPTVLVPSLVKVTLVAGEPEEVQVKVEEEDPGVYTRLVILGGAEGRTKIGVYSVVCKLDLKMSSLLLD